METPVHDLLNRTLETIKLDPDGWDQDTFVTIGSDDLDSNEFCDTTCCLAGHSMLVSGQWRFPTEAEHNNGGTIGNYDCLVHVETGLPAGQWWDRSRRPEESSICYDGIARRLLGLSPKQANAMFYGWPLPSTEDYLTEFSTWCTEIALLDDDMINAYVQEERQRLIGLHGDKDA